MGHVFVQRGKHWMELSGGDWGFGTEFAVFWIDKLDLENYERKVRTSLHSISTEYFDAYSNVWKN